MNVLPRATADSSRLLVRLGRLLYWLGAAWGAATIITGLFLASGPDGPMIAGGCLAAGAAMWVGGRAARYLLAAE